MIKYMRFKLPVELQVKHKNEKRRMQNDEIQRKKMMRVGKKMMRVGEKMIRVGKKMMRVEKKMMRVGKKMMRVGKKMMRVGKKMMRVGKRKGSDKRRCRHVSKRREWIRTI